MQLGDGDALRPARHGPELEHKPGEDVIRLPYRDRAEGGRVLAAQLSEYSDRPDVIVLGLPRGGVPVAYQVARSLNAPLDVFVVRKLGVPGHEELAMGAIASGNVRVFNQDAVYGLGIPDEVIEAVTARERQELERRERLYRGDRPALDARGQTAILVDDGLATGSTMLAAVRALRQQSPARLVVGVPIGSHDTCATVQDEVDEIVCAAMPRPFYAVGLWYEDFSQTSDAEVHALLARAAREDAVE